MAMKQPQKSPVKAPSTPQSEVAMAQQNTNRSQSGNNSSGSGGAAPGSPAGYVSRPMVSRGRVPGGPATAKTLYAHNPTKPAPRGGGGLLERRNTDLDGLSSGAQGIDTGPVPRNGLLSPDASAAVSRRGPEASQP